MYILDQHEQDQKLSDLVPVRDEDWTRHFVEPETGEPWMLYYPHSEQHGGGPRFLRRGVIPADVTAWVVRLLRDGSAADAMGAGTDLSSEPEVWAAMLDRLETERESLPLDRLRAFIRQLGVLRPMNLRPFLGKADEEVTADAAHFRDLARRAAVLSSAS